MQCVIRCFERRVLPQREIIDDNIQAAELFDRFLDQRCQPFRIGQVGDMPCDALDRTEVLLNTAVARIGRDYGRTVFDEWAIVSLLACYGLRRGQVSALQLSDIDWGDRTIEFAAHKGGKAVRHALIPAVGHALVEYLRDERPESPRRSVFLRHRRPHERLSPGAITERVRQRMVERGLPPLGPHALRHSFATRLLCAGQPVKTIADLLGHRSLASIAIYAKVDVPRLLGIAGEWPEVGS